MLALFKFFFYLCEELICQNDAFPSQFQSQVASTDVIEQEILEQIREIDRLKASIEAISQTISIPGMDAMANLFIAMMVHHRNVDCLLWKQHASLR